MSTMSLSSLRPGMDCRLLKLELTGSMRRRLLDMGFLPGADLHCAFIAPSGSPLAIVCKQTLIALRLNDCSQIQVTIDD